jgi:hypothetical protein
MAPWRALAALRAESDRLRQERDVLSAERDALERMLNAASEPM